MCVLSVLVLGLTSWWVKELTSFTMKNSGRVLLRRGYEGYTKIVVILVVLAVVGVGAYAYVRGTPLLKNKEEGVPVKEGIAGWKMYENSLHGVRFQYPAGFQLTTRTFMKSSGALGELEETEALVISLEDTSLPGKPSLIFEANPTDKGAEGTNMSYILDRKEDGRIMVRSKEVLDLGEYYGAPRGDYPNVLNGLGSSSVSGERYLFWIKYGEGGGKEQEELLDKIVSTFVLQGHI